MNNLTVIIPTLNSSKNINKTLTNVNKYFKKIIIVDGKSIDNTLEIAKNYNLKIYLSNPNRGGQLCKGAKKCDTDWFLFLHSDTLLANNSYKEIKKFIIKNNKNKAAYFKLKFNEKNKYSLLIENLVYLRNIIFRLPYGDQGLLISKSLYNKIGGFKPMPIMEDIYIIRKIGYRNLYLMNSNVITDAHKYIEQGWIKRPLLNLTCLLLYFIGYDLNKINKIYYNVSKS